MPLWPILALLTAFFESLKDVFSKRSLSGARVMLVAWSLRAFALVLLVPAALIAGIPTLRDGFWTVLFFDGLLNAVAAFLYMKAIASSDLSLTVPMITFTPLFLLITSPVLLGELPGVAGIAGVALIVLGSYLLNIRQQRHGLMAPFRALLSHRGPRMMLAVALIFSITSNLDKLGVERSSPVFWSLAVSVMITLMLTPTLLMTRRRGQPHAPAPWGGLVVIGILIGLGTIVQMTAIQLTLVAYVIAIKRTSALMTVFFGHYIFNEPGIRDRAIGTAVMVVGVVLITVFGR